MLRRPLFTLIWRRSLRATAALEMQTLSLHTWSFQHQPRLWGEVLWLYSRIPQNPPAPSYLCLCLERRRLLRSGEQRLYSDSSENAAPFSIHLAYSETFLLS